MIHLNGDITDSQFRVIMETLERIGVAKTEEKILYPYCYILKKKRKFYLIHYKEVFSFVMKPIDKARLNTVATILREWKMIDFEDSEINNGAGILPSIYIVTYPEKKNWKIRAKTKNSDIKKFMETL